ncbi:MAG: dihydrolipoamide acetyltransferase family protein [Candidatus Micrarchaeia archaeon]
MAFVFRFPDVGEGITEGRIVKWLVKEGERVREDQPLGEIETDKAVVEMPSPKAGVVLRLYVPEGGVVKVGGALAAIGEQGESAPEEKAPAARPAGAPAPPSAPQPSFTHPLATPAIRRLARELGVELAKIKGTGPAGRITEQDVRAAASVAPAPTARAPSPPIHIEGPVERVPLVGVRKLISQRMASSAFTAPHVTHMDECDVTDLWRMRESKKTLAQAKGIHLTFLPLIARAAILSLKHHPIFNSSIDEEKGEIIVKKYFNLGIAVDTPEGLVVVVVKDADKKDILELAREMNELSEKARERKVSLEELRGSTFTITNIGTLGGIFATPIINPGECAILGTGKIRDAPAVVNGGIAIRKLLPLSLSFDHRITDGAAAARFVNSIKQHLEDPSLLLVDVV